MATFKPEEIKALEVGGNGVGSELQFDSLANPVYQNMKSGNPAINIAICMSCVMLTCRWPWRHIWPNGIPGMHQSP